MNSRELEPRDTTYQSPGERLLRLGSLVRFLLRHGLGLPQVAHELGVGAKVCLLAVAFRTAPDGFKFQALVEDWNLLAIRTRLQSDLGFRIRSSGGRTSRAS